MPHQAFGRSCRIHGDIAAADDADAFIRKVRNDVFSNAAQHGDGTDHIFGIFSFDAQLFVAVGTDGNVNSIIIFLDIFDPDILSNGDACMDIDTRPKDMTDVTVKDFRRRR